MGDDIFKVLSDLPVGLAVDVDVDSRRLRADESEENDSGIFVPTPRVSRGEHPVPPACTSPVVLPIAYIDKKVYLSRRIIVFCGPRQQRVDVFLQSFFKGHHRVKAPASPPVRAIFGNRTQLDFLFRVPHAGAALIHVQKGEYDGPKLDRYEARFWNIPLSVRSTMTVGCSRPFSEETVMLVEVHRSEVHERTAYEAKEPSARND
ncbi:hypothetical protein MPH_10580 [Macrophomina phaseolina MS6]|uniref:Uncharacterized protein n=1 Tax=Macrophomina phaseolina (strain MS6) TaxID=1126212 RepID=K2S6A6_MACPH|nr:hypothetical protein MPH_10580 [Macrophomina phaseolina MS6]